MIWTRQLVQWQLGQTITAAPIYVDGKIYIGVVGAEYRRRGRSSRRWTPRPASRSGAGTRSPAPGEPGGDTWPAGSKEYLRGGATIWQAPAVDPKLGLLYFSTGNAGSDWFGGDRPGKNLYAASIVALDLKTGKLKWYFQQVHHDIWDFDSASPVVLFDAGGHAGHRAGEQDRLALHARPRDRQAALRHHGEAGAAERRAEDLADAADPATTAQFTRTARPPAKDVAAREEQAVGPLEKVPVVVAKEPFTPPPPGKLLIYGNGPAGRRQLAADRATTRRRT